MGTSGAGEDPDAWLLRWASFCPCVQEGDPHARTREGTARHEALHQLVTYGDCGQFCVTAVHTSCVCTCMCVCTLVHAWRHGRPGQASCRTSSAVTWEPQRTAQGHRAAALPTQRDVSVCKVDTLLPFLQALGRTHLGGASGRHGSLPPQERTSPP